MRKYGKVRYLIAKNFLSKPLDEIVQNNERILFKVVAKLLVFANVLDDVFPSLQSDLRNLGNKYLHA
jgi:hypothetical protein